MSIKRFLVGAQGEYVERSHTEHLEMEESNDKHENMTDGQMYQDTEVDYKEGNKFSQRELEDEHTEKTAIEAGIESLKILPDYDAWHFLDTGSNGAVDGSQYDSNLVPINDVGAGDPNSKEPGSNIATSVNGNIGLLVANRDNDVEADLRDMALDKSIEDGYIRRIIRIIFGKLEDSPNWSDHEIWAQFEIMISEMSSYSPWDLFGACESEILSVLDDMGADILVLDRELESNVRAHDSALGLWKQLVMMMRLVSDIQLTEDNVNRVLELYRALEDSDTGSDMNRLNKVLLSWQKLTQDM